MTETLIQACHVPPIETLHPIAVDAVAVWAAGGWDLEMLYIVSLLNSTYTQWAECLIRLKDSLPL